MSYIDYISNAFYKLSFDRKIYRVIYGPDNWQSLGPVPIGNTLTGFWSLDIRNIINLIKAHDDNVEGHHADINALTVAETDIDNVEILVDYDELKSGHDDNFDSSEIFVKKVLNRNLIKIMPITNILNMQTNKEIKSNLDKADLLMSKLEIWNKDKLSEKDIINIQEILSLIPSKYDRRYVEFLQKLLEHKDNIRGYLTQNLSG